MSQVYKHYSQSALNRQYNNRLQTPDFGIYLERYELLSREAERRWNFEKDIAYGNHPREKLDIFPGKDEQSPVVIFIHGGYWRSFDKSSFRFIASSFVPLGITVICINYPLAPEASMDQIVDSCEKAVEWISSNYLGKKYLLGHSAGAHLAAMLLTKEIGKKIDGFVGLSGLYNLIPIQKSDLNESLQMDDEGCRRNSPILYQPLVALNALILVGKDETDEFKSQTSEFNKYWEGTTAMELENVNHFSIVDPDSAVFDKIINHWKLK